MYAPGVSERSGEPVRGITRLEKLVFLALEEGGFKEAREEYRFKPYELGPYSKEVIDFLQALRGAKLVKADVEEFESHKEMLDAVAATGSLEAVGKPGKVEIYSLTDRGVRVGERVFAMLSRDERKAIRELKRRFNQMPLPDLLKYVYSNYRRMTSKSKILDEVFGVGSRPQLRDSA